MKNFNEMTFEEKNLNLTQCYEAGYSYCDIGHPINNLLIGIENDPEWFDFAIEDSDHPQIAELFAGVYASSFSYNIPNTLFEILCGQSVYDCIKAFLIQTYKEDLPCTDADVNTMLEDLLHQKTQSFNANDFKEISTRDIVDFMENADCGVKSYIDGTYYYKVNNCVESQAYALYFNEDDEPVLL